MADEGGPERLDLIEGRVIGARPDQQIVLFAKSGAWYVQPFANEPFTQIQSDSIWRSTTHLGTEYAALLVEPGYEPPPSTTELPREGGGVIAVGVTKGETVFWQRWWFLVLCVLAAASVLLGFYSYRLHEGTRQLNIRFEERLAERNHVAQELHDTLLQGVISASMQLHVAVDRLPEDLPAKPSLMHVLQIMGQVLEEGRNALQRLGSSVSSGSPDIEQALYRLQHELAIHEHLSFRVNVEGRPRPVHPIIRDEVYRIVREALVRALVDPRSACIEVEVKYKAKRLRVIISEKRGGIVPQAPSSGIDNRELSVMRERAERIGARLKVTRHVEAGTEIELSVPGHAAFPGESSRNPFDVVRYIISPKRTAESIATEKGGK